MSAPNKQHLSLLPSKLKPSTLPISNPSTQTRKFLVSEHVWRPITGSPCIPPRSHSLKNTNITRLSKYPQPKAHPHQRGKEKQKQQYLSPFPRYSRATQTPITITPLQPRNNHCRKPLHASQPPSTEQTNPSQIHCSNCQAVLQNGPTAISVHSPPRVDIPGRVLTSTATPFVIIPCPPPCLHSIFDCYTNRGQDCEDVVELDRR